MSRALARMKLFLKSAFGTSRLLRSAELTRCAVTPERSFLRARPLPRESPFGGDEVFVCGALVKAIIPKSYERRGTLFKGGERILYYFTRD
jgi:hypothetical protein